MQQVTDKMVGQMVEKQKERDEIIQNENYRLECLEPEISGLEEVIIKYELDLEQGQGDLDHDHNTM